MVILVAGCGDDSPRPGAVPAAAFERGGPDQKAAANFEAVRRRAEERSQREAETKEAMVAASIEAVTVVPPDKPRQLSAACNDVADAMDALLLRQVAGDDAGRAEWARERMTTLDEVRRDCRSRDTIDVAACQAHAMRNAPDELVGAAFDLIARCREKYGDKPPKVGHRGS